MNDNLTVSPTHSPFMVLGVRDDYLMLLKEGDNDVLVFKELKPSYDLKSLKVMQLVSSNHGGKGIVVMTEKDGHHC